MSKDSDLNELIFDKIFDKERAGHIYTDQLSQMIGSMRNNGQQIISLTPDDKSIRTQKRTDKERIRFEDTVGLPRVIDILKTWVTSMLDPSLAANFGLKSPRSMLLHGPSGTGKTMIAQALANESGVPFMAAKLTDLTSMFVNASPVLIEDLFKNLREKARRMGKKTAVLFIDEVDAVASSRDGGTHNKHQEDLKVLTTLLNKIDGFKGDGDDDVQVVLVAATNRIDDLDSAFLSRMQHRLEVPLPNTEGRKAILQKCLEDSSKLAERPLVSTLLDYDSIARHTEGFSGRDITMLVQKTLERLFAQFLKDNDNTRQITTDDLIETRTREGVFNMQRTQSQFEKVSFDDIGGNDVLIQKFRRLAGLLRRPDVCKKWGMTLPTGILMHGEPGTGKTLFAKAIACESGVPFIHLKREDFIKAAYGKSEENLKRIFDDAIRQARDTGSSGAIIFMDEVDSIAPQRGVSDNFQSSIVNQLLQLIQGFNIEHPNQQIVVISATNNLQAVDPAFVSRMTEVFEVGVPKSQEVRLQILGKLIKKIEARTQGHNIFDLNIDLEHIAQSTNGLTGRDLENILNIVQSNKIDAELAGINQGPISTEDVLLVLRNFKKGQNVESRRIGFL